ncbi:MAG: sulfatase [Opitutales bacterium]
MGRMRAFFKKLSPVLSGGFFVIAAATPLSAEEPPQNPPNILFIIADDLGSMDIGPYNPGSFYETPHLDEFARSGLTFRFGYGSNPVCSPTRFSIMTGKYPSRHDATNWFTGTRSGRFDPAPMNSSMPADEFTIAEALKEGGYATYFAGKWHLGADPDLWPEKQGFDINKGGWTAGSPSAHGGGGYFSPYNNPRLSDGPEGEFLTDRLAEETVQFLRSRKDEEEPFFAYLSFYQVHTPLQAPEELVRKYEAKAERLGLDQLDAFGEEEQVWPTDNPRRVRVVQSHPVYAAMVESMDAAVGRVLFELDELGLSDNTIVIFTSDDGGLATSEGHPTSNLPLRGGKGWVYEGGLQVPLILRWPGVTAEGSTTDQPVMNTDFYPTFIEAAGLPLRNDQHLDGVSLLPMLRGEGTPERDGLFWHYPHYSNQGGFPGGAVQIDGWKLIERYEDGRVHLYNLRDDIEEQNDLAEEYPERVERMRERLHAWYTEVDAKFLRARTDGPQPWCPGA